MQDKPRITGNLVSVCILTRNRNIKVQKAIDSVINQKYKNIEIVVVDNNSDDQTYEILSHKYPKITLIKTHRNLGCPMGRNLLMANANGVFIVHLDDDAELHSDALTNAIELMSKYDKIGIVSFNIIENNKSRINLQTGYLLPTFSGGANLMRSEVVSRVGYYDDNFFRQGEEVDFAIRMFESSYYILYCREAILYHNPDHITQLNNIDFLQQGFINSATTLFKYAPAIDLLTKLIRKITGYGYLFFKKKQPLLFLKSLFIITLSCSKTISKRTVHRKGFTIYNLLKRVKKMDYEIFVSNYEDRK